MSVTIERCWLCRVEITTSKSNFAWYQNAKIAKAIDTCNLVLCNGCRAFSNDRLDESEEPPGLIAIGDIMGHDADGRFCSMTVFKAARPGLGALEMLYRMAIPESSVGKCIELNGFLVVALR